jgi:hypothetical protein
LVFVLFLLLSREWRSALRSFVVGAVVGAPLAFLLAHDAFLGAPWLGWLVVGLWVFLGLIAQGSAARYVEGPYRIKHRAAFFGALLGHALWWLWAAFLAWMGHESLAARERFFWLFFGVVLPSSMLGSLGATLGAASRRARR